MQDTRGERIAGQTTPVHHDEFYTYDGLQRLKDSQRGNLSGAPYSGVTSKNFAQDWTLDQLGNWPTFQQDNDGNGTWDLEQDRSHNAVNEISSIIPYGSIVQPAHDAAGNMTTIPQPLAPDSSYTATYDAWNRLVKLQAGMTVVQTNEYDGLNRRIQKVVGTDTFDYYYNEAVATAGRAQEWQH